MSTLFERDAHTDEFSSRKKYTPRLRPDRPYFALLFLAQCRDRRYPKKNPEQPYSRCYLPFEFRPRNIQSVFSKIIGNPLQPGKERVFRLGSIGSDSEFDSTIEVSDGSVEIAFFLLGVTPVSVGEAVFGIECNGLIVLSDSSVEVAFPEPD